MKRLCVMCGKRWAVFRYKGRIKHDRTHTLCLQCYRRLQNQLRRTE